MSKRPIRTFSLLAFFFLLIYCASFVHKVHAQLSPSLQTILENGDASDAFWAVVVTDSAGNPLEQYHADKLIRPASAWKLVTAAACLNYLGGDYTFLTGLYGTGGQQGNTWSGDLLVRGSGDPSISGFFYEGNPLFLFERWAELLRSMGITRIDGNLIGNESFFDDVPYPRGWEWDDLSYYYGVEINALSFNNNVVDLEVLADGEIGEKPEIQWFPFNTPYVDFINEQVITPPESSYDESYRRILGTNTIILRSTLPRGYYETEPLSVTQPSLYFIDTFRRVLQMEGIRLTGRLITDRQERNWGDENRYRLLHEHESVPLRRMIEWQNKESDNFYAEMLLKTLAAEMYGVEGSTELGLEGVEEFIHTAGLDTTRTTLRDGSGMASATLIRAGDMNLLLHYIQSFDWFEDFYTSLSVAGVDGTLQSRFGGSFVRNQFFGKTGFVSGVRSLTGYLHTKSGQRLIVTLAANNFSTKTSSVDRVQEQILEALYSMY
ncbi:MAG: D-alanyl-D-alanine carboxypeptidase/D-alanyl-D-alanine-endopeptidase [Balneolaceae bacterium]